MWADKTRGTHLAAGFWPVSGRSVQISRNPELIFRGSGRKSLSAVRPNLPAAVGPAAPGPTKFDLARVQNNSF